MALGLHFVNLNKGSNGDETSLLDKNYMLKFEFPISIFQHWIPHIFAPHPSMAKWVTWILFPGNTLTGNHGFYSET